MRKGKEGGGRGKGKGERERGMGNGKGGMKEGVRWKGRMGEGERWNGGSGIDSDSDEINSPTTHGLCCVPCSTSKELALARIWEIRAQQMLNFTLKTKHDIVNKEICACIESYSQYSFS